jgi:hypothetical protein
MSIVPINLRPSQLQRFVQENLDYAEESDSVIALVKAKRCRAGLRQLRLVRPADIQQGGVGRGSGFSMSWDPASIKTLTEEVSQWIAQREGGAARMFGVFHADTRDIQSPFPC